MLQSAQLDVQGDSDEFFLVLDPLHATSGEEWLGMGPDAVEPASGLVRSWFEAATRAELELGGPGFKAKSRAGARRSRV